MSHLSCSYVLRNTCGLALYVENSNPWIEKVDSFSLPQRGIICMTRKSRCSRSTIFCASLDSVRNKSHFQHCIIQRAYLCFVAHFCPYHISHSFPQCLAVYHLVLSRIPMLYSRLNITIVNASNNRRGNSRPIRQSGYSQLVRILRKVS